MNKRWLLALLLTTLAAAAIVWLCWPQPQIGPSNYHRIQEGMTPEQVTEIIGLPPGDYCAGPRAIAGMRSRNLLGFPREERGLPSDKIFEVWEAAQQHRRELSWWGNDYAIIVAFDESNKAVGWRLLVVVPATHPTVFERLKQRLGW